MTIAKKAKIRYQRKKTLIREMRELFYVDSRDNIATMMFQRHGAIIPPTNVWSSNEGCFVVTVNEGITGIIKVITILSEFVTLI